MKFVNELLMQFLMSDDTLDEKFPADSVKFLNADEIAQAINELRFKLKSVMGQLNDKVKQDDLPCLEFVECLKAKISGDLELMKKHANCTTTIDMLDKKEYIDYYDFVYSKRKTTQDAIIYTTDCIANEANNDKIIKYSDDVIKSNSEKEFIIESCSMKTSNNKSLSEYLQTMIRKDKKLIIEEFNLKHHKTEYGTAKIYLQYILQKCGTTEKVKYEHFATESPRKLSFSKCIKIKYWDVKITVGDMISHSRFKYLTTAEAELCATDALIEKYHLMDLVTKSENVLFNTDVN